jgi:hypothetical protein
MARDFSGQTSYTLRFRKGNATLVHREVKTDDEL